MNNVQSRMGAQAKRLRRVQLDRARAFAKGVHFAIASPSGQRTPAIRIFWWTALSNFGDVLTPHLLSGHGVAPILAPPESAELFGVGSIYSFVPRDFSGKVWGTGLLSPKDAKPLANAEWLGVRGKLTRDFLKLSASLPLGDPGLLADELARPAETRNNVGVVPHWSEKRSAWVRGYVAQGARLIDPQWRLTKVLTAISQCEIIVASSLHGVIVADSFGIPSAWAPPNASEGGVFKFDDYESIFSGSDLAPRRFERMPVSLLEAAKASCTIETEELSAAKASLRVARRELVESIRQDCRPLSRFELAWEQVKAPYER